MLDANIPPRGVRGGDTTTEEVDTPRACARVVALALMSDGRIREEERDALRRCRAFARLGLDEQAFWRVVLDLCGELLALPPPAPTAVGAAGDDDCGLVERMLGAVRDPGRRAEVLRVLQACVLADARAHPAKSSLLRQALDAWRVPGDASSDAWSAAAP